MPAEPLAHAEVTPLFDDASNALRRSATILSAAAGIIHLSVTRAHFQESALFGAFFVVSGILQIGFAVYLWRRAARWLVAAIVAVNLAVVVIWIISRTTGLLVGPEPGVPEHAGLEDITSTVFEVLLAAALLLAMRVAVIRRLLDIVSRRLVPFVLGATLVLTGFSVHAGVTHHEHGDHAQEGSAFGAVPTLFEANGQHIDVPGGGFALAFRPYPPRGESTAVFTDVPGTVINAISYDMPLPMGPFAARLSPLRANEQRADMFFGMLGTWRMTIRGTASGKSFIVVVDFRVRPSTR